MSNLLLESLSRAAMSEGADELVEAIPQLAGMHYRVTGFIGFDGPGQPGYVISRRGHDAFAVTRSVEESLTLIQVLERCAEPGQLDRMPTKIWLGPDCAPPTDKFLWCRTPLEVTRLMSGGRRFDELVLRPAGPETLAAIAEVARGIER